MLRFADIRAVFILQAGGNPGTDRMNPYFERSLKRSLKALVDSGDVLLDGKGMRADELAEDGDMDGRTVWLRIVKAIEELLSEERPEGAIAAAVVLGFHVSAHRGREPRAWWLPAVYLLALGLITAFRTAYYGSPIPNTFYAKVGGIPMTRGLAYLGHFLSAGSAWLLLPVVLAVVGDRRWWPGALFVAVTTVYVVAIGGDVFGDSRFLVPALPPLAVLAVRGAERSFAVHRAAGVAVTSLLPAAACWFVFGTLRPAALLGGEPSQRSRILERVDRGNSNFERAGKRMADVLRNRGEEIQLVAAGAIGSFGFYSRLPVLDYLGIVDPVVARSTTRALDGVHLRPGHQRSDADYVFSREPDYIFVPRREGGLRIVIVLDPTSTRMKPGGSGSCEGEAGRHSSCGPHSRSAPITHTASCAASAVGSVSQAHKTHAPIMGSRGVMSPPGCVVSTHINSAAQLTL